MKKYIILFALSTTAYSAEPSFPTMYITSTCMGSTSMGVYGMGGGISGGTTWIDQDCVRRTNIRVLEQTLHTAEDLYQNDTNLEFLETEETPILNTSIYVIIVFIFR